MRNKYILLLVLITALTFALGIASSCKKNQESESDSSSQNESVTDYVLTLDKNVTVYEYESAVINYTVQGTVEKPQWRSADTTIAMVSEGVVYGVKAGVTTITAKIGEIEETCEVKVEKTIYAPTIKFAEEIVIENGDVYKSEVVTIWNGQKAENDYYTWTLADGMANDICSIESDGNKVAITALKKGETAYYVSTTFRGVYVNCKVSIKVIKSTATIVPVNNEIEPEKEGFGETLCTSEIGGETESFGIAFRKGSDLTRKTEEAIKELIKENKLSELAKKYGVAGVSEYEPSANANESSEDFKKIKDRGTLIIGITDYKPMDYREEGSSEWIGFDADLAKSVCAKLGVTAEFKEIEWGNKLLDLKSGKIDCIWNGMTITDEITGAADVTKPYMEKRQVAVVLKKNADKYSGVDKMGGLRIAAETGSAGENFIKANSSLSGGLIQVDAQSDAFLEVMSGKSEVAIVDYMMARALIEG